MSANFDRVYPILKTVMDKDAFKVHPTLTKPLSVFTEALLFPLPDVTRNPLVDKNLVVLDTFSNLVKTVFTKYPDNDNGIHKVNKIKRNQFVGHVARRIVAYGQPILYPVLLHVFNNGFLRGNVHQDFLMTLWDILPNDRDVLWKNMSASEKELIDLYKLP
jgi:hypothetical protein